ncbi:MAG: SIMPL domain-containing protein [Streptosporangiaceae bacterium]
MGDPAGLLLSVRGEARLMVPPDYATVAAVDEATRGSKAEALRAAAAGLDSLTTDLAAQGGVALDASTGRRPLTWSAQSATTHAEHAHDEQTGSYQPTGQMTAAVAVTIAVRAFELLDTLGAVLAAHEAVSVHQVTWHVDWDNPAWPDVRAAAIHAAIAKGRDYAAALGGSLRSVQHIADAGLLGGDNAPQGFASSSAMGRRASSRAGGEPDAPSLDPVPQELTAIIEARLTADGVTLTTHLPPAPAAEGGAANGTI